jgi:hypothetical protein
MDPTVGAILAVIAGGLFSIIVPYLMEWIQKEGEPFDWRMIIGQILATLFAVGTTLLPDVVDFIPTATLPQAFFYGTGIAVTGRIVQKGVDTVRVVRNRRNGS